MIAIILWIQRFVELMKSKTRRISKHLILLKLTILVFWIRDTSNRFFFSGIKIRPNIEIICL